MWKRIIAPALVVSLFWLIVGGATTFYLSWHDRELDRVIEENVACIRAANAMQETVWQFQSALRGMARNRQQVPDAKLLGLASRFNGLLQQVQRSADGEDAKLCATRIRTAYDTYFTRLTAANGSLSGDTTTLNELAELAGGAIEPIQQFALLNDQLMQRGSQDRQRLTGWIIWGRAAMLLIGPGLGLLMGLRLARQLQHSMTRISVRLRAVAGDLEQEVGRLEITPQADLHAIQQQLEVVAERIRSVLQELNQARMEAVRAEQLAMVGELAAGVAHELRNPMTSVKLLIQTVQRRWQEAAPPETFNVVMQEILHMESIIQGLLDFARPQQIRKARYDLRQNVLRAVSLTEARGRQSNISLYVNSIDEPVWVNADCDQIHQVCVNLLLNGIESINDGGSIHIVVTKDDDAEIARVQFKDSGAGIPDAVLPRLFDPFVTSKDHGHGLGLAVSRRIVSNHSGRLSAENHPSGGAVMTLELPLDHLASVDVATTEQHRVAVRKYIAVPST